MRAYASVRAPAGPIDVGLWPGAERHVRDVLLPGEMVGVSSRFEHLVPFSSEPTRAGLAGLHARVRPSLSRRLAARAFGRLVVRKAIGRPRPAVPGPEQEKGQVQGQGG